MFLEYFALVLLCLIVTGAFYIFIYIHDIPYHVALHRDHPHKDAIYWSCWVSLFTLHALWPFLFIWASTHPLPKGVHVAGAGEGPGENGDAHAASRAPGDSAEVESLRRQVDELKKRLAGHESGVSVRGDA
jgi:hypothetical protein